MTEFQKYVENFFKKNEKKGKERKKVDKKKVRRINEGWRKKREEDEVSNGKEFGTQGFRAFSKPNRPNGKFRVFRPGR